MRLGPSSLPIADDLRVHLAAFERSMGGSLNFSVSPSARALPGDSSKDNESATDRGIATSGRVATIVESDNLTGLS